MYALISCLSQNKFVAFNLIYSLFFPYKSFVASAFAEQYECENATSLLYPKKNEETKIYEEK